MILFDATIGCSHLCFSLHGNIVKYTFFFFTSQQYCQVHIFVFHFTEILFFTAILFFTSRQYKFYFRFMQRDPNKYCTAQVIFSKSLLCGTSAQAWFPCQNLYKGFKFLKKQIMCKLFLKASSRQLHGMML